MKLVVDGLSSDSSDGARLDIRFEEVGPESGEKLKTAPRAVVVVGPGQVVTAIVLRALGWRVELAANVAEGELLVEEIDAMVLFVRISHSHLRSLRRPNDLTESTRIAAIVDSSDDTPLPGFDATIAVDDVDNLVAYVRSITPTNPSGARASAASSSSSSSSSSALNRSAW